MKKRFSAIPFFLILAFVAGRLMFPYPPTHAAPGFTYLGLVVTGTTNPTPIKDGPGIIHTWSLATAGASSVITIYDLSKANCTGSLSGTVIYGPVTLPASGVLPGSILLDQNFFNGLCIQNTTAASTQTVTYN